jgi:hypothetical protein
MIGDIPNCEEVAAGSDATHINQTRVRFLATSGSPSAGSVRTKQDGRATPRATKGRALGAP